MTDYDIIGALRNIENNLLDSMIRNFKRHRAEETVEGYNWTAWQVEQLNALREYSERNRLEYPGQFDEINQKLDELIETTAQEGEAAVEYQILSAIRQGATYARTAVNTAQGAFFKLNDRKLDALIKSTHADFEKAEYAVLRRADGIYRRTIFNAQVYANTGAGTYAQAVDMAVRDFMRAGLNCVEYKNGARHTLSDYAEMAIRTANKRANLMGEGNKRYQWGITTVVVNHRYGACELCAPYVGKVFIDDVYSGGKRADGNYPLLSTAIDNGLFHPNCKDGLSTWFEGISRVKAVTPEEEAEMERREKLEQQKNYYNNQAEKNSRISKFSLDEDNKKIYKQRARLFDEKAKEVDKQIIYIPDEKIQKWELENYKKSKEEGLLIMPDGEEVRFGGTSHHVVGNKEDIALMKNAIFTHNHPTDNTFSQNDIVTGLVKGNLKEMRAVTSTGDVHILTDYGATEQQRKEFSAAYQQMRLKANNIADSKIRKGQKIDKAKYIKSRLETFMQENAKKYNLHYVKQHIDL